MRFLPILLVIIACQPHPNNSNEKAHWANIPAILNDGLEAHGGLAQWEKMNTMQYSFMRGESKELHEIDLKSRKVRITHDNYTLGFDGRDVWVTPDLKSFGDSSPRFYHNLIFYFYAIPFVLADPGINYEILPDREINGRALSAVKISYNEGVGDAPEDYYIAHFDKESNELYLLLYTVTYFSGETNERFSALIYDEWEEVNGFKFPKVMKGFRYEADSLGAQRYVREFDDIIIDAEALNQSIFEKPNDAEIDPLISN